MKSLLLLGASLVPLATVLTGSVPVTLASQDAARYPAPLAVAIPTHGSRDPDRPADPTSDRPATWPASSQSGESARARRREWALPIRSSEVVRPFDAPAQNWLPGHRGVDLRAPAGTVVRSPAPGRVAFVGMVAGRPVLSVDHADPRGAGVLRSTYEPVVARVAVGEVVDAGTVIGTVVDASHCPGGCLHWGARIGDRYVDPWGLTRTRVRLWPTGQRTG